MSNEDRELKIFLYQIISEISKTNAPIIFKGGLALKDLLYMENPDQIIERRTIDIDAKRVSIFFKDQNSWSFSFKNVSSINFFFLI